MSRVLAFVLDSKYMLNNELQIAISAARLAGKMTLEHYATEIVAESKIGVDKFDEPVTAADREASRLIVEMLQERFPNDAILSEEEFDDAEYRLNRDRVWIIDPIDGTSGFIKKDGDFAVQIGLAVEGAPVLGVVLLPFHEVTYFASKGGGAFRTDDKGTSQLNTSSISDYSQMLMAVSRNHRSPKINTILAEFGVKGEMQRGSVGLKVGLIADQACDIYIHLSPRTKLWDTCAPQIILEEAGGRLTDLWGNRYRYDVTDVQNWGGIVASNGTIHDETIDRLQPLLSQFGRLKSTARR